MTVVVPYDEHWPAMFTTAAAELEQALAGALVDGVHHIGSTSVPGMPAKPIIDMMAGVVSLDVAGDVHAALEALGYERRPHRVDAVLFVRADAGRDTYNVQLTVAGSELWRERLTFRDALRTDPALVRRYAALKRRLLVQSHGRVYAAADKRDFVREVLARRGHSLRDDRHIGPS